MWIIKLSTFSLLLFVNIQNSSLGSINYFTKRPFDSRRDDINNQNDIDNNEIDINPLNDLKTLVKNRRLKSRRRESDSSTSVEGEMNWKEEWKAKWSNIKKLTESFNKTEPGDQVYMVAARK